MACLGRAALRLNLNTVKSLKFNFHGKLSHQILRMSSTMKHKDIEIITRETPLPEIRELVDSPAELEFGRHFSDHMLLCPWDKDGGWEKPKIVPFQELSLPPGLSALQYATQCIEGLKACCGVDGKIRLFRPMEYLKRLKKSAVASSLPDFDETEFLECIKDLIRTDQAWMPKSEHCSLYIRANFIGTEESIGVRSPGKALLYCITSPVGTSYKFGSPFNPTSAYADPEFVRAWPGGGGEFKMGANYGRTIRIQKAAESKGCDQVLWLFGKDCQLTELGTMNVFVHWINTNGDPEIATPPLNDTIVPGVTRKSLLELGDTWDSHNIAERPITIYEIKRALAENRLKEVFGSEMSRIICPVKRILYLDENIAIPTMDTGAVVAKRFYRELTDIQYGRRDHQWAMFVE